LRVPGVPSFRDLAFAALLIALSGSFIVRAHEEIPGMGAQNFSRTIDAKDGKYRIDVMYSPSLPTAGEPANIEITVKRLLATPDPLLGSEVPLTDAPSGSLLSQKTQKTVVASLPVHSEGEAGSFGVAEYRFPQDGSYLIRFVIHTQSGEDLTSDFPVTVQANAGARFRFWVNLALGLLIVGLTGVRLSKVRSRGGDTAQMLRPAVVGLVSLAVVIFVMDRFVVGAVLDLRKPKVAAPPTVAVTTNEDGSYTIPEAVQKEQGMALVEAKAVALDQPVMAYGSVESRPDLTAVVQAPLWGRLEFAKGPIAVGDTVKQGQALVDVVLELSALERGLLEQKDVDIKGAL